MRYHGTVIDTITPPPDVRRGSSHSVDVVLNGFEWRPLPQVPTTVLSELRVMATRWHAITQQARGCCAEKADQAVKIVLRNMHNHLPVSRRMEHDTIPAVGMHHVIEPAASVRYPFREPYDALHLHKPNSLITERTPATPRRRVVALSAEPTRNTVVQGLGHPRPKGGQANSSFEQLYTDYVSIAIVARLLTSARRAIASERPKVTGLPRERLKRAIDYIENHLARIRELC